MFVIPLGLGTKLKRWPVVTLGIGVLWVFVMIFDRAGDRVADAVFKASAKRKVRDTSRSLFVEYCRSRQGAPKACQKYASLVWPGFPSGKSVPKKPRGKWQPSLKILESMEADGKVADAARKELKTCDSRQCFVYKDIVWQFLDSHRAHPQTLAALSGYGPYRRAMAGYQFDIRGFCRELNCLVKGNVNVASVVMAQVRHGGFGHLFSNLIALIIFGIYVEQRTSRAAYLTIAAIGGTAGMLVHTLFFSTGDSMVLGGYANVSAIMGMFYVFFFNKKMRLQVWLPRRFYRGTAFYADVKYCFPLFFLLTDISGGFDSGFTSLAMGRVAHFAHLTGFLVGALFAGVVVFFARLPRALIYESEVQDLQKLEASRDMGDILARARRILDYNPNNVHAMEVGCGAYLRWAAVVKPEENRIVFEQGRLFVAAHLQTVCALNARSGEMRYACKLLSQIPLYMPYRIYLGRLGQLSTLKLADFALSNGHPLLAFRLYDFYLCRYSMALKSAAVETTASNVIGALTPSRENIGALKAFLMYHPDSLLSPRVAAWLTNLDSEGLSA